MQRCRYITLNLRLKITRADDQRANETPQANGKRLFALHSTTVGRVIGSLRFCSGASAPTEYTGASQTSKVLLGGLNFDFRFYI